MVRELSLPKEPMRKFLLAASLLLAFTASEAQYQIGQSLSNYAGTNSLYFNPSNVVDSRFKFYMNMVDLNVHVSNDYITWNGAYHPFALAFEQVPVLKSLYPIPSNMRDGNGKAIFMDSWLTEELNGDPKNAFVQAELRGPSFMFNLGKKTAIGITTRARAMGQFTNVSEPLARMMRVGFDTNSSPFRNGEININQAYSDNSFNINVFAFSEIGLTLGQVVYDNGHHFVKVGATGKYFIPIYGQYIRNTGMDFTVYGQDSIEFTKTDIEYGYVRDAFFDKDTTTGKMRSPTKLGSGLGLDIGFTYEYRPRIDKYRYKMNGRDKVDPSKNKYLFRIQASLNDLGSVKMKNSEYVRGYKLNNQAKVLIDGAFLDTLQAIQDRYDNDLLLAMDTVLGRTIGFEKVSNSFEWKLPANLNVNVDYQLHKNFYLNVLWIQSLRGKQVNGIRGFSLLALTPRFESRWFDVAIPLQLTQNYRKARIGANIRMGPLWIGTDNVSGLFAKKNINGADLYFGVAIPIHRKKEKDKDKDGVSNKYDKCKKIPGVWEFKGCPDTDGDGVQDTDDRCVTVPGLKELHGCPDADGDGITDGMDSCVDDAGPAKYNGCPDTDGDGLVDREDDCPELAGPKETKGCPDRDGDSVLDPEDECPDEPGKVELNGCPDTDNDGIMDDKDKCPQQAGPQRFLGCPDTDGDQVPDYLDLCPLEIGLPENNGCPKVAEKIDIVEIPEEDQEILNEVFSNLEFATGSAEIAASSYASLDMLVELLEKRPEYRIYIAGHTDNTGNAKLNEKLSKDRAESVRKYLVDKGIDPERIKTEGFGSSRPVESNETPEGRQKNRRVEFRVIK